VPPAPDRSALAWDGKRLTYEVFDPISTRVTGLLRGRLSVDPQGNRNIDDGAFVIDERGAWKQGMWLPVAPTSLPTPIAFREGDTLSLIATAYHGSRMEATVGKAERTTRDGLAGGAEVWRLRISGRARNRDDRTMFLVGDLEVDASSGLITRLRLQASGGMPLNVNNPGVPEFIVGFALKSVD
jgi:hypothetical protein